MVISTAAERLALSLAASRRHAVMPAPLVLVQIPLTCIVDRDQRRPPPPSRPPPVPPRTRNGTNAGHQEFAVL